MTLVILLDILLFILLYALFCVFDCAIIGTAVAFFCSKPKQIISVKRLAIISLIIIIVENIYIYWLVLLCPLDLTLTIASNNQALIRFIGQALNSLIGTHNLSDILMPSFSFIGLLFYAIEVAIAVFFGRFLVGKYHKKYYREEIS